MLTVPCFLADVKTAYRDSLNTVPIGGLISFLGDLK